MNYAIFIYLKDHKISIYPRNDTLPIRGGRYPRSDSIQGLNFAENDSIQYLIQYCAPKIQFKLLFNSK